MKIHTHLNAEAIRTCLLPSVYAELSTHGSRTHTRRIDMRLSGSGTRRVNSGTYGADENHAATWDEWGTVIARIFALDSSAICGDYKGAADFGYKTDWQYGDGTVPLNRHANHRWEFRAAGEQSCKCGAVRRWRLETAA